VKTTLIDETVEELMVLTTCWESDHDAAQVKAILEKFAAALAVEESEE
jgi:hypothetical protein